MTLLVAVKSCQRDMDLGYHNIIRSTWGAQLIGKAILRFFVGANNDGRTARTLKSDEVALGCADDYHSLPHKTRDICRWTQGKMVNHVFLCDNDTYVKAGKLLKTGFERYDYAGKVSKPFGVTFPYEATDRNGITELIRECHPWASGGYGYFLSAKAASLVADKYPKGWAEDLWVGQVLGSEIAAGNMIGEDLPAGTYSEHFPSAKFGGGYDPKYNWMMDTHEANK